MFTINWSTVISLIWVLSVYFLYPSLKWTNVLHLRPFELIFDQVHLIQPHLLVGKMSVAIRLLLLHLLLLLCVPGRSFYCIILPGKLLGDSFAGGKKVILSLGQGWIYSLSSLKKLLHRLHVCERRRHHRSLQWNRGKSEKKERTKYKKDIYFVTIYPCQSKAEQSWIDTHICREKGKIRQVKWMFLLLLPLFVHQLALSLLSLFPLITWLTCHRVCVRERKK